MSYFAAMFTGIIEAVGIVRKMSDEGSNKTFWVESPLSTDLKLDQSVSHSGVCLTVEEQKNGLHRVTSIEETLKKTNLGSWEPGTMVNLERCLRLNDRLDGHLVQGHVDTKGSCTTIKEKKGSREFEFEFPEKFTNLVIEKGSVCVNGISLTAFNVKKRRFSVAIIPYTFRHTNIHTIKTGDKVNIEFDIIGKYIIRSLKISSGIKQ